MDIHDEISQTIARANAAQVAEANDDTAGDFMLAGDKLAAMIRVNEEMQWNRYGTFVCGAVSRALATGKIQPQDADRFAATKLAEAEDIARILTGDGDR